MITLESYIDNIDKLDILDGYSLENGSMMMMANEAIEGESGSKLGRKIKKIFDTIINAISRLITKIYNFIKRATTKNDIILINSNYKDEVKRASEFIEKFKPELSVKSSQYFIKPKHGTMPDLSAESIKDPNYIKTYSIKASDIFKYLEMGRKKLNILKSNVEETQLKVLRTENQLKNIKSNQINLKDLNPSNYFTQISNTSKEMAADIHLLDLQHELDNIQLNLKSMSDAVDVLTIVYNNGIRGNRK